MPSCLSGWSGGPKNPMDAGNTPLEGSPFLKHPFVPPDRRVGAWGRDSRPTAFLKQGKSFPTPLRGAEGEADKEGSLN